MSKWRPIETAPKAGKGNGILTGTRGPYLLLSFGGECPIVGFWNGHAWDDGDFNSNMDGLTHWQPLPKPPDAA